MEINSGDIQVKAYRKTIQQTAIILNVSAKTVSRYLAAGLLQWAGNQVSVDSIKQYLSTTKEVEETIEEVEDKMQQALKQKHTPRRIPSSGWVSKW